MSVFGGRGLRRPGHPTPIAHRTTALGRAATPLPHEPNHPYRAQVMRWWRREPFGAIASMLQLAPATPRRGRISRYLAPAALLGVLAAIVVMLVFVYALRRRRSDGRRRWSGCEQRCVSHPPEVADLPELVQQGAAPIELLERSLRSDSVTLRFVGRYHDACQVPPTVLSSWVTLAPDLRDHSRTEPRPKPGSASASCSILVPRSGAAEVPAKRSRSPSSTSS